MNRMGVVCLMLQYSVTGAMAADIVPPGAKPELLWNDGEFTEGVAVAKDGVVYFSDIAIAGKNPGRIMKFNPKTKQTSVHVDDSGQSNGLFFSADGKLLAVCGANKGHRALCIMTDRLVIVVADKFEGKKLNAPNDLVVHPRFGVYFSDPRYVGPEPLELDHMSVYRYHLGKLERATTDITKPNGVILSPDAKTLYVAETDNGATGVEPVGTLPKPARYTLNAFPIKDDGSLGPKRVLADFGKDGGIDGMTTDTDGRIYAAFRPDARKGILIVSPDGQELGHIPTDALPTNCTFGKGDEKNVLYITAGSGLYRMRLNATGYHPELAP